VKKIVFVTPPDARYGFSLTGAGQVVTEELRESLPQLMDDPATGIAVIDERLAGDAVQEELGEAERRWSGVIVVLPAPEAAAHPAEDYALRLIRRAVGYQVRLNV
jgi:V/A-type H+-transporting ATPase subunit F